ncbi:MAG: flagellar biosynthesis protein FlgM [Saprospiraceae bacterium]|nr:flagellar biosynthesis protein FlgM [Saprospiraceae bacterium]
MKWQGRRQSDNVRDVRGQSSRGGGGMSSGMIMNLVFLFFRGGITKTKLLIGAIILGAIFIIGNPLDLFSPSSGISAGQSQYQPTAEEEKLYEFVKVVMADNEDVWRKIFSEQGATYREPTLVVFNRSVQSACGGASSATGPFYCPADHSAYIDLSFYDQLSKRFGAPGDFAMAYVIAHEIGHHIQNLTGTSTEVQQARGRVSQTEYNELSVRLELQADFYAGVWAHHAQKMNDILEEGDIEEALRAASAIGDDNIQKQTQGHVTPESFTHGTSEQRVRWFKKGFTTGDIGQGDTFNARSL